MPFTFARSRRTTKNGTVLWLRIRNMTIPLADPFKYAFDFLAIPMVCNESDHLP